MLNNDILRRLRFITQLNDSRMIQVFSLVGKKVDLKVINSWLKKEDHPEYEFLPESDLADFLNALIIHLRGPKDGTSTPPQSNLDNNVILKKVKIAFNLTSDDQIEIFRHADFKLSKHELSAFSRRPGHKNYRECKDQVLRNFLNGLQKYISRK